MVRPTIRDLAKAADVSVSTVNRMISGHARVREATMQRVLDAAEEIGFYGLGAIQQRMSDAKDRYRLSVILLQSHRRFYQMLGQALERAAADFADAEIDLTLSFIDELSPDNVAARMRELGSSSDALAVVTAEHPLVTEAVDTLLNQGVPVFSLISPLSARGHVGFIGLDNWKVGRTAAWAFDRMCKMPGKIGILVGNHRYRNQEMNESGFRSYFREHGDGFVLLEPRSTFESAAVAREVTENLLAEHPDLQGLFISGGGISGAIAALRDSGRAGEIVATGYELMETTKAGLMDGTLTLVISHPLQRLAAETISALTRSKSGSETTKGQTILLPFDITTSENL
jgi:LacI family transcriptional regulator